MFSLLESVFHRVFQIGSPMLVGQVGVPSQAGCYDADGSSQDVEEWKPVDSPAWPDRQDIGRLTELKLQDGEVVRGRLQYEEMTFEPGESPYFFVARKDGTQVPLTEADFWRFARA